MKEFKDSITMSIVEFRKYYDAIERVREVHYKTDSGYCHICCEGSFGCEPCPYPCPTIKALDGEIGSVEPVKLEALDGEQ